MATLQEIKELALHAARGTAPANFSNENVKEALHDEINAMCGSINEFMRNQYDIFEIIITAADEVVPKKALDRMSIFAEMRVVPQGQKTLFHKKAGKNRAKAFITRVGLSGVYETFRLDSTEFEVPVKAVGSAGTIDFERFLDGAESMSDIMDIILEGLEDAAYLEICNCLMESINNTKRPGANKYIDSAFSAAHMQKLVNTVKRYDESAVILACDDFIDAMGPDAIVPAMAGAAQGIYSPDDIEAIHKNGRIKIFRGTPVVELPQGYIDENNDKTWLNPQFAYVLPTGREKVVKFVFEGATQMWTTTNRDQSMEINFYKKMGAAIITYNNWGIYQNQGITNTAGHPYGF